MRRLLDFMASLLWFIGWALFAAILFIASTALVTGREATSITYHKKFGKVGESTICPEMLEAA